MSKEIATFRGITKLLKLQEKGKKLPSNWKNLIGDYIERKKKTVKENGGSERVKLNEAQNIRKILLKLNG